MYIRAVDIARLFRQKVTDYGDRVAHRADVTGGNPLRHSRQLFLRSAAGIDETRRNRIDGNSVRRQQTGQRASKDKDPRLGDAVASWVLPRSEGPRFPGPLLIRTRCPDTSSNSTL